MRWVGFGLGWCLLVGTSAASSSHQRMLELLAEIRESTTTEHFYLAAGDATALRERLAAMGPDDGPDLGRWEVLLRLGEAEQTLGNEEAAIAHLTEAYEMLPELERDIAPLFVNRLFFKLGMAHLRAGETRNCALTSSPEACILPMRGGGIHVDPEPSRRAIRYLTECVQHAPPDSEAFYSSLWLLNLAYMTVGAYPAEVPPEYRISPEAFESDEPMRRFQNVSHAAGVATFSLAGGAVSEDFDADGYLDLLVSTMDPSGPLRIFMNNEDGTFTERTDAANLTGLYGGLNLTSADYDGDGDVDVLVLRGGWMASKGRHPNSLLRNNGDGTFTDVTLDVGLGDRHLPTQTASWADYDNDGDLDLYVGNESTRELPDAPCQLFENRGGRFVDVAPLAGVTNDRFAKSVVWGDYDSDGWEDLYVSNIHGDNRLYRNGGDGTFEDVAPELGVTAPRVSFPAWFWDYNNDGALDLFVASYDATIGDLARYHLGRQTTKEKARLYASDGAGGYDDVTAAAELDAPSSPMGANYGDLDGDGFLDFYLGTGFPPYHSLMPNQMYRNHGGERFLDVSSAGGFGHLQKGHAVVFADFDRDGDHDVFEQLGGFFAGDRFHDALFENPGPGADWLSLLLVGDDSNRGAVGARVTVRVRTNSTSRTIYRWVRTGGSFGASPHEQLIGLGQIDSIEWIDVIWPGSARSTRIDGVAPNNRLVLREGWPSPVRAAVAPSSRPR